MYISRLVKNKWGDCLGVAWPKVVFYNLIKAEVLGFCGDGGLSIYNYTNISMCLYSDGLSR